LRLNSQLIRRYTAALALTLSLATPAVARPDSASSAAGVVDIAKVHITNFGRVSPTYYRGGQPKGHDYSDLAALGVKTLINLTSDDAETHERAMAQSAGLAYVEIPMTTHVVPTAAQLAEFLRIVNDSTNQPVYVHCVGGRHRTGVMTAVYRLTHDGWTADRAFQEMKQFKFGADFLHPEFKSFVYSYGAQRAGAASPAAAKVGG
jgi:protein tyrosine/serine phosphatase